MDGRSQGAVISIMPAQRCGTCGHAMLELSRSSKTSPGPAQRGGMVPMSRSSSGPIRLDDGPASVLVTGDVWPRPISAVVADTTPIVRNPSSALRRTNAFPPLPTTVQLALVAPHGAYPAHGVTAPRLNKRHFTIHHHTPPPPHTIQHFQTPSHHVHAHHTRTPPRLTSQVERNTAYLVPHVWSVTAPTRPSVPSVMSTHWLPLCGPSHTRAPAQPPRCHAKRFCADATSSPFPAW